MDSRVIGSALLIAGCCIGAGMLGLPVLSAKAGFLPSIFFFVLCWLYMLYTGLLMTEVNLWFREDVSFISMAGKTLGKWGQVCTWILFLFLFYMLMVAYIAGSGALGAELVENFGFQHFPNWAGSLFFTSTVGILIYLGTGVVDVFNRLLMIGLVISYFLLVGIGIPHIQEENLFRADWYRGYLVIPAMIISFGFHNLIPSLTAYLKHDAGKLKKAIFLGSGIPLIIYLIWEFVILGIVSLEHFQQSIDLGEITTKALTRSVEGVYVTAIAEHFAFFVLFTSFLSVALSFLDFLSDGFGMEKKGGKAALLVGLVLVPPFLSAIVYPQIFLVALNAAGAFGAVLLFGVLPALMVWLGRYRLGITGEKIAPGGRICFLFVILFAFMVFGLELYEDFARV